MKPDEQVADVADRGWRARATAMVRDVLKRLEEQRIAARIAAKNETKAAAKAAVEAKAAARFAARNAEQDRLSAKPARKAEVRTFIAARRQDAAGFGGEGYAAVRGPGREHGGCPRSVTRPDGKGCRLVDGEQG